MSRARLPLLLLLAGCAGCGPTFAEGGTQLDAGADDATGDAPPEAFRDAPAESGALDAGPLPAACCELAGVTLRCGEVDIDAGIGTGVDPDAGLGAWHCLGPAGMPGLCQNVDAGACPIGSSCTDGEHVGAVVPCPDAGP